jgi:membrane protein implicated in regulation of membrane protease activity
VLDIYDALWKFTVPATLVYAALIWRFALGPAKGEPRPKGVWPLGLDIVLGKLAMTIALLLCTLGVIALGYDLVRLVADNWPYIVLALAVVAVIAIWAWLAGGKRTDAPPPPGSDDLVR